MKVVADGFSFDFTDAIDAFVFDEKDPSKATFHGQPMKAVDIVAELPDAYLYVEIKDFHDSSVYANVGDEEVDKEKRDNFKWLKNYLKYKFRDSYLFRHAEDKVDKPVHYVCLLTFDNTLNTAMRKFLQKELPVGRASKRWKRPIAHSCQVVNIVKWNENFPKWPVNRL